MHLMGYFNDQRTDDNAVSQRALALGIAAPSLSSLYITQPVKRGLYLGYAGTAEPAMERGVLKLASALGFK